MNMNGQQVEGGSLVHQAVHAIRAHIRTHDMKVGDTLPGEGQFAADLVVSRAVMREAFDAIALKLIDVGNGRTPRVLRRDPAAAIAAMEGHFATSIGDMPKADAS